MAAAGAVRPGQVIVPSLPRTSPLSRRLGALVGNPFEIPAFGEYVVEQVTFALALVPLILRHRPHVVLTSDPNLGAVLIRLRPLLPRATRLLLSNSAPFPPPFPGGITSITPTMRRSPRPFEVEPRRRATPCCRSVPISLVTSGSTARTACGYALGSGCPPTGRSCCRSER